MNLSQYEYYRTDLGVLYCGDCLEILPLLEPVDLVLTDPPYPELKGGVDFNDLPHGCAERYRESKSVGTPWGNDISALNPASSIAKHGSLVFCSFHAIDKVAALINGKRVALITWFQRNAPPSIQNSPHFQTEFIWAYKNNPGLKWRKLKTLYDIPKLVAGCYATERITDEGGKALHPTQKPVWLIIELLQIGGETILDPYFGSGTTGAACERLNRKWVGIEIEEKYCAIAKQRIENERKQLKLF